MRENETCSVEFVPGAGIDRSSDDGGVPNAATAQKVFDNLDFQHAVQAYLLGLPPVNQFSNRQAILSMGPANHLDKP